MNYFEISRLPTFRIDAGFSFQADLGQPRRARFVLSSTKRAPMRGAR